MQRAHFIFVEVDFISGGKKIRSLRNLNMKNNQIRLFNLENTISLWFYEMKVNHFLNSERKIIYIQKRVNNFLNKA